MPGILYAQDDGDFMWKAGMARVVITPEKPVWMAGYSAREKPADGMLHDLWAKALALEDAQGHRVLLITMDLIGIDRQFSEALSKRLMEAYGLKRSDIILSSSHTHSGPVINKNLKLIYPPFDSEMQKRLADNKQFVFEQILVAAGRAMNNMHPALVSRGVGIARFAVNRRENKADEVLYATQLKGPTDHSVQVLLITDPDKHVKTVVFGYACHATCLDINKYSGDYPGYAQIELEKAYPGATAMFFAGCGADQNPIPRRSVPLTEQYGKELAAAVERVLEEPMRPLRSGLITQYNRIKLGFSDIPDDKQLDEIINSKEPDYIKRWAVEMKKRIAAGEKFPDGYAYYPVQTWQLGDLSLAVLGGEVVSGYAIKLRSKLGDDLMVMAYANDVMAYIPTEKVLEEGGYEGKSSMRVYDQPGYWAAGLEDKIVDEVVRQVQGNLRSAGLAQR
jgi:hypothetical protein